MREMGRKLCDDEHKAVAEAARVEAESDINKRLDRIQRNFPELSDEVRGTVFCEFFQTVYAEKLRDIVAVSEATAYVPEVKPSTTLTINGVTITISN